MRLQQLTTTKSLSSFSSGATLLRQAAAFGIVYLVCVLVASLPSASASSVIFKNQCQRPLDVVYTVVNSTESVQVLYKDRYLLEEEQEKNRIQYPGPDSDEEELILGPSIIVCKQLRPGSSCAYTFDDYAMSGMALPNYVSLSPLCVFCAFFLLCYT
jgi:hypothetical protein